MLTSEEKKVYFDRYWQNQRPEKTDSRSLERSEYVWQMMNRTEGSLLDVGCGRGVILGYFAAHGFDVTGIDISPDSVRAAEKKGYKAAIVDLETDNIAGSFDVIICLEVLQQVYDPVSVLKKLADALADDGEMIISLPNEFHIVSRLKLMLGRSHLGHFDHSHIRLFSPPRNRELFEKAGLKISGKAHISIVPPGWRFLSRLFRHLASAFPSFFALSSVYKVERI